MRTLLFAAAMLSCLAVRPASCQTPEPSASLSGFTLTCEDFEDPRAVGNLETLCRVWGYVKYHHPVFCDTLCRVDVDSALFVLLPRVLPVTGLNPVVCLVQLLHLQSVES